MAGWKEVESRGFGKESVKSIWVGVLPNSCHFQELTRFPNIPPVLRHSVFQAGRRLGGENRAEDELTNGSLEGLWLERVRTEYPTSTNKKRRGRRQEGPERTGRIPAPSSSHSHSQLLWRRDAQDPLAARCSRCGAQDSDPRLLRGERGWAAPRFFCPSFSLGSCCQKPPKS